jgi:hypothetical protein
MEQHPVIASKNTSSLTYRVYIALMDSLEKFDDGQGVDVHAVLNGSTTFLIDLVLKAGIDREQFVHNMAASYDKFLEEWNKMEAAEMN